MILQFAMLMLHLTNAPWWLLLMSFLSHTYPHWIYVMGKGIDSHLQFNRIIRKMTCSLMNSCETLTALCDTTRLEMGIQQGFISVDKTLKMISYRNIIKGKCTVQNLQYFPIYNLVFVQYFYKTSDFLTSAKEVVCLLLSVSRTSQADVYVFFVDRWQRHPVNRGHRGWLLLVCLVTAVWLHTAASSVLITNANFFCYLWRIKNNGCWILCNQQVPFESRN